MKGENFLTLFILHMLFSEGIGEKKKKKKKLIFFLHFKQSGTGSF